jgi:hypothetical protein
MPPWAVALAVTLLVEVPLVAALFPGRRWRMAGVSVVMNVATNLTLNLLLPRVSALRGHYLMPGETLAVVSEAAAYALASRDVPRSVLASSLANLLSFSAGFLPFVRAALR